MKLCTAIPLSSVRDAATSNKVVSTGNDFCTFPPAVCNRSRASVYAEAGFDATGPEVVGRGVTAGIGGGARPSRSAFSCSDLRRRSSLSAAILALVRSFATASACFSRRLA